MNRITNNGGFFADWYVMGGVSYPKVKKKYIILKFEWLMYRNVC